MKYTRSGLCTGLMMFAGVLLVTSIAVNAWLGFALYDSFAKLQFARIFPLGYAPNAQQPSVQEHFAADRSIGFWGDSRSYLWYVQPLSSKWRIVQRAHGSQTSSQVRLQLAAEPVIRTTCAVLQVGINDLHPLGTLRGQKAVILADLESNLLAIRESLRLRADRVVLSTLFPPAHIPLLRRLAWDPQTLQTIADVNRFIREAGAADRVAVLDADALLRDGNGYLKADYVDPDFFLHLNEAGYTRLNAQLSRLCELPVARMP